MTNEESRRASGRKMEEDRRASGRAFRDDLNALAQARQSKNTLTVIPKRGGMSAARGTANWDRPSAVTGGIASPLTETPDTREYFAETVVMPADGYFVYSVKAVKKLTLTDADSNPVEINLAEPDYA